MKRQNKIERPLGRGKVLAVVGLVAVVGAAIAVAAAYGKLRDLWLEQCVIRDATAQVRVTHGRMVMPDVIMDEFGLRNGANLALIDFDERRRAVLKKIPNIRAIDVRRHLPDRVSIDIEERVPVARMNYRGNRGDPGKVADTDGVVFIWQRGTEMLPVIREPQAPGTATGCALTGRTLAALRLVEAVREPGYGELGILTVDVSKPDYLVATLADYSTLKITWAGMDEPTAANRGNLVRKLEGVLKAMRTRVSQGPTTWNATDDSDKGYVYAESKGTLL